MSLAVLIDDFSSVGVDSPVACIVASESEVGPHFLLVPRLWPREYAIRKQRGTWAYTSTVVVEKQDLREV